MLEIDSLDLKLKLLAGDAIEINGIGYIRPLTLRQIKDMGYANYNEYVSLLVTDLKETDTYKQLDIKDDVEVTIFDMCLSLQDLMDKFVKAIKNVFQIDCDLLYDKENHRIYLGDSDRFISNENLEDIREILLYQNCLKNVGELKKKYNPADEVSNRIAEKLKSAKKNIEKYKNKGSSDGSDIDLADIISAVSTKSYHRDKINIWDYTIYQLYDDFQRLRMVDDYDITIQSMLQGAKDAKLKHWASKIANEN